MRLILWNQENNLTSEFYREFFQNYNSLFEVKIVCKSKECVQFPSLQVFNQQLDIRLWLFVCANVDSN